MNYLPKDPTFYSQLFELIKENKTSKIFKIDLKNSDNKTSEIKEIKIENDREFHSVTGLKFWGYFRTSTNWKRCEKTGLFTTSKNNIFFGDRIVNNRKILLVFIISDDYNKLRIDIYKNYHLSTNETPKKLINSNYRT